MPYTPKPARAACALAAAVMALSTPAHAQQMPAGVPPPQNVVALTASASAEVVKDWLTIVFTTTRQAGDAATVQAQLKQALDAALTEARKQARPGQLEVSTGNFSIMPRYTPKGGISGWQGTVELIVEGRDTQAIAQLTGRVQTLSLGRVAYSLSREAREKVEGEVAAQAIDRFRARAEAVSRQFGFGGYTIREVTVASDSPMSMAAPMMRAAAAPAAFDEAPLPTEAGKATVTATVSGSVQMK